MTPKRQAEPDVTLHAIFMRHGEKDAAGNLTDKGHEQARDAARSLTGRTLKTYVPPNMPRVQQTIKELRAAAPHTQILRDVTRKGLQHICSGAFAKEFKTRELSGTDDAAQWYLDFGNQRFDARTRSPHEIAQYFAHLLMRYFKMASRCQNGSNIDLVHGTQQALPEALLKEVLLREDGIVGFEKLADIGGGLHFAEMVEFRIEKIQARTQMYLLLRGKRHELAMDRLHTLAQEYRGIRP